jgi:hypothetical protein
MIWEDIEDKKHFVSYIKSLKFELIWNAFDNLNMWSLFCSKLEFTKPINISLENIDRVKIIAQYEIISYLHSIIETIKK